MEILKDLHPLTLVFILFIALLFSTIIQKFLGIGIESFSKMKRPAFSDFQEMIKTSSETFTTVKFISKEFSDFKQIWTDTYNGLVKRIDNHEIRLTNIELQHKSFNKQPINKKRCILLEDEMIMTEMLTNHLSEQYLITATDDPEKAINMLKKNNFDFALCDIYLNNDSGLKFWYYCLKNNKLLNRNNGNQKLKIILYSGKEPNKLPALPPHAEFLQKPFQWDELELKINYILH